MFRAGCSRIALLSFLLNLVTGIAYSQTSGLSVTTSEATAVSATSAELHGIINPGGSPAAAWFDWGTTTALGTRTDAQTFTDVTSTVTFAHSIRNLQPHTTYYFRAAGYRSGGVSALGDVRSFTTADAPATVSLNVTTGEATAITATAAELHGSINGGSPAAGWFEWGTTTGLGTRTDVQIFNSATSPMTFALSLRNLQSHTTYYFRAVGYGLGGTAPGEVRSFTTTSEITSTSAPSVATSEASAVTSNSAELRGIVNPGGSTISVWFEWGTTTSVPNQTNPQTAGNASATTYFAQTLRELQPNTTYYFRAVAQRTGGTAMRGAVRSFTTGRVSSTAPQTITEVEQGVIKSGYVIITPDANSSAPTATLTFGIVSRGLVQSQAGIIPEPMTTDASMFVEVIPTISRNIGVAIVNPGSFVNAVTFILRDEDGITVGTPATVSIQAHQQVAKFVNELFGADTIGMGFRGSLRMQSSAPFAVVGLRFSGYVFSTLPTVASAPVPGVPSISAGVGGSSALIVPQFVISGGWASQIALVNNTGATVSGRIDVFDASGNPMVVGLNGETKSSFTYSIPVGGTFLLTPRDSNGQSPL